MARMDHNPDNRHSFGIEDHAWNELGDIADDEGHRSISHLLRELVYRCIREHRDIDTDGEGHVPSDGEQRAVYLAALDASNKRLRLREHHLSKMANDLNTLSTTGVEVVLRELRAEGYISLMGLPADHSSDLPSTWRVKPRAVDPDDWTYNESQRDSRRDITPLLRHGMDTDDFPGQCLSHHPNSDGTECLKCGQQLDSAEYNTPRCECGSPLDDDESRCPACRMAGIEVEA